MGYCENLFTNYHLGIDFRPKTIETRSKRLKLTFGKDTLSQERYKTITQSYLKGGQGIILVQGIDDKHRNWMKQITTHAQEGVSKLLVANKSDPADRVVQTWQGQKLAYQYSIPFFENSAKNGINIYEIFNSISQMIIDKQNKCPINGPSNVQLSQQSSNEAQKKQGGWF